MCVPFFSGSDRNLCVFKEAYEEFKHILLAFIYDKDDQNSPVTEAVSFFDTMHKILTDDSFPLSYEISFASNDHYFRK